MNKHLQWLPVICFVLASCGTPYIMQNSLPYKPARELDPPPKNIVLLNSFDVKVQSYRDKKEEQFILLINGALHQMAASIEQNSGVGVVVERETVNHPLTDEKLLTDLLDKHDADYIIAIDSFNVYFDQTEVVVTETDDGKSREAFYDILCFVNYKMMGRQGSDEMIPVEVQRFHSSRSVLSGLFAAGPSIVSNHKDATEMTELNTRQFLRTFFPGKDARSRPLYTSKGFKKIPSLLTGGNGVTAREICERETINPDRKVAAKAFYNLAVLAEHDGEYEKAGVYLEESQRRFLLPNAQQMRMDY